MPLRNALYNAGYLINHLLFPRSYSWYRLTKILSMPILGLRYFAAAAFIPDLHQGSVQGYRHSANSFARSLVTWPPSDNVHSHVHWIWGVTAAVESGIVPLVLIRNPEDVLTSTIRRTRQGDYGTPYRLMPTVCLLAWYGYYAYLSRQLDRVCLVDFDEITCAFCYPQMRPAIESRTGLKLTSHPDFSPVNPSIPSEGPEHFSAMTRLLLTRCVRFRAMLLERRFRTVSRRSDAHKLTASFHRCPAHKV